MAPVIPDPTKIRAFESQATFQRWLAAHHDKESEVWLKIHKKGSGLPSVSHAEALDVALCWGWIDGLRKSFDADSFLQRFSPRKKKSIWSQINIKHVARLTADDRMQPAGLRQVEAAKADGRWKAAYASSSTMTVPKDLMAAIRAEPKALATFETLNKVNLYALGFRLGNLKTEAGRARRVETFVAMLARGQTIHPNGKGKAAGTTGAKRESAKRKVTTASKAKAPDKTKTQGAGKRNLRTR